MKPGGSMPHSQGPSNNYYPKINQIPRIDTYLFKVHSNSVLPSTPKKKKIKLQKKEKKYRKTINDIGR